MKCRTLKLSHFEMRDKADDVVGSSVNKPTDVLLANVACGFHNCPSNDRKTRGERHP